MFQPIVENSIKHALSKSEDGGTLHIFVQLYNDLLIIELSDSGKGITANSDTNQERQNRSIGMDNINSRLEAIYANRYNLSYAMSDGRFKTHITIPFELAKVS